ncbi:MAG: DoxX family protein [Alphaproteobacteria bacterium]|nr:DoxX family protein [Alphaproteobacteria bacterium]
MKCTCIPMVSRTLAILNGLGSLLLLLERFWMSKIFFQSGLLKVSDWGNTLFLFANEYSVPLLSPKLAAYAATAVELSCPILLIIGLGSRLAAIPMIVMTGVIEFTYTDNPQHFFWAMVLATILCFGPGKISLDHLIWKKFSFGSAHGTSPSLQV